ncbi:MAG: hypothetical protein ABIV07_12820 [Polaromonas sp.]
MQPITADTVIIDDAGEHHCNWGKRWQTGRRGRAEIHRSVAVFTQVEKASHLDSLGDPVIKGVNIVIRRVFTLLLDPSGSGF